VQSELWTGLLHVRSQHAGGSSGHRALLSLEPRCAAGEWFPVKRKLLRHCIALTKVVRSEEEAEVDVSVDVDTDIFDR